MESSASKPDDAPPPQVSPPAIKRPSPEISLSLKSRLHDLTSTLSAKIQSSKTKEEVLAAVDLYHHFAMISIVGYVQTPEAREEKKVGEEQDPTTRREIDAGQGPTAKDPESSKERQSDNGAAKSQVEEVGEVRMNLERLQEQIDDLKKGVLWLRVRTCSCTHHTMKSFELRAERDGLAAVCSDPMMIHRKANEKKL